MASKKLGLAALVEALSLGSGLGCGNGYEPTKVLYDDDSHQRVQMGYCVFNQARERNGELSFVYTDPVTQPDLHLDGTDGGAGSPDNSIHGDMADPTHVFFEVDLVNGTCRLVRAPAEFQYRQRPTKR